MKFKIYKIVWFFFNQKKLLSEYERSLSKFTVPLIRNPPSPPFIKVVEILNKDEYDKRWGQWLEYGLETTEEYYKLKEYVIRSGRSEEFVLKDNRHKNQ